MKCLFFFYFIGACPMKCSLFFYFNGVICEICGLKPETPVTLYLEGGDIRSLIKEATLIRELKGYLKTRQSQNKILFCRYR
jgi:hypothetical protein